MTYAQLTFAQKAHQQAARTLRYAGFAATCVKTAEVQPYQVNVKNIDTATAKQLQEQMCTLLKSDIINIVEI